jgi:hydrogenase nickel incorporation protein HypA/HybF
MHELPFAESIVEIAQRHAKGNGAHRITDIHLVIGRLSSVVDESIQFYWDIISQGTLCEGARLHFERIPAVMECLDCGERFEVAEELTPCPRCSGMRVQMLQGDEFYVASIDIEKEEG